MNHAAPRKRTHFSIFPFAAEEAEMKRGEQSFDNEGGHVGPHVGHASEIGKARILLTLRGPSRQVIEMLSRDCAKNMLSSRHRSVLP